MALNDISLTSGMRNNLLSLQDTTKLINRTQTRLSTGKSVNTALDNPTNFFAAQTGTARATDLTNRKDGMSEAVQMVQAANAGITGITSLIQSAQGVAQAALATASTTDRATYAATFDTLLTQIDELASDSGYRGINFLNGDTQTVEFAPKTNDSTLQINGFNATSSGLGVGSAIIGAYINNNPAPDATPVGAPAVGAYGSSAGGVFSTSEIYSSAEKQAILNAHNNFRLVSSSGGVATIQSATTSNGTDYTINGNEKSGSFNPGDTIAIEYYSGGVDQTTGNPNPVPVAGTNLWAATSGIQSSAAQLEGALTTLRSESSSLSASLSVVTTRQSFTDNMVTTLQTGADNLTLADTNQEGANLLMLQTRQSLGITSLSLASQASQAVLKLF